MIKVVSLLVLGLLLTHGCTSTIPAQTATAPSPQAVSDYSSPELVIVYDNNAYDNRLRTAWGFSCLLRLQHRTILFDTGGDSSTLLHNMRQLQIDAKEVDAVVLSHIHGDHVGGLNGFLEQNSAVTVYLPQSFPQSFKSKIESLGAKVEEISEGRELFPGVYTTGELGNGIKEQSLILTTSEGLLIVTGCAHPGIVNIIRTAKDIVPGDSVYLVMGGFHLSGLSSIKIESIIDSFEQLTVKKVAPCHCSGENARQLFATYYGDDYIESGVGTRVSLPW